MSTFFEVEELKFCKELDELDVERAKRIQEFIVNALIDELVEIPKNVRLFTNAGQFRFYIQVSGGLSTEIPAQVLIDEIKLRNKNLKEPLLAVMEKKKGEFIEEKIRHRDAIAAIQRKMDVLEDYIDEFSGDK